MTDNPVYPIPGSPSLTHFGDAQAVIDTAYAAGEPQPLDPEVRFYAQSVPAGGDVKLIDVEELRDSYRDRPRRKTGTYQVHDAFSFVEYLGKHSVPETEVWADVTANRVTGVVNAHTDSAGDNAAGWEDHKVIYSVQHTDAWKVWINQNGKLLDQSDFAELIEDRLTDIIRPTGADMLELAQSFQATIGVTFNSSKLLGNGERQLEYTEDLQASAGRGGHLEIPASFELRLTPFEGALSRSVIARFRYRIVNGSLKIGYRLERPEDVLREAFNDVVDTIRGGVSAPVFHGSAR